MCGIHHHEVSGLDGCQSAQVCLVQSALVESSIRKECLADFSWIPFAAPVGEPGNAKQVITDIRGMFVLGSPGLPPSSPVAAHPIERAPPMKRIAAVARIETCMFVLRSAEERARALGLTPRSCVDPVIAWRR